MSEGKLSRFGGAFATRPIDRRDGKWGVLSVGIEESVIERGDVIEVGVVNLVALSDRLELLSGCVAATDELVCAYLFRLDQFGEDGFSF